MGDSLRRNQYTSFRALFECAARIDTKALGVEVVDSSSHLLVEVEKENKSKSEPSYYYPPNGTIQKLNWLPYRQWIWLDSLKVHPAMREYAGRSNVTFVINFGRWIQSRRSDTEIFLSKSEWAHAKPDELHMDKERVGEAMDRPDALRRIVAFVAAWLERNMVGRGTVVIWHGFSPWKSVKEACTPGKLTQWTTWMVRGLGEALNSSGQRKQFFVDQSCLITSAPKTVYKDIEHFYNPGVVDFQNQLMLQQLRDVGLLRVRAL